MQLETKFTPQAGTWGLQGIVRIPDRAADWVFFVTFGQVQGEHEFDEAFGMRPLLLRLVARFDGVLSWQSQPAQRLDDEVIREFIGHDDRINNIHLFIRTARTLSIGCLTSIGVKDGLALLSYAETLELHCS